MLIGVICGDYYHPAEVVIQGMNNLDIVKTGVARLEYVVETTEWSKAQMDRYDVIVLSKGNSQSPTNFSPWLTEVVQSDFLNYVEQGKGLLFIHSGTVGYQNEPHFRHLAGGGFKHHPKPGPVSIEITGSSTLPGIQPQTFSVHDEHYLMEMFHDDLSVFMTSTSNDEVQPAGWTRQQGEGRVCVLTPGHYIDVWLNPGYQYIIEKALLWCAGQ